MAGNLPVPNGVEMKIVWALDGTDSALNILHFSHQVGQSHSQSRADGMSALVKTTFTASGLGGLISARVAIARVETRHMDSNTDPWFVGAGSPVAGTAVDAPLPAAISLVASLRTGLRGRSYNGRFYQWGWTEAANDTNGGATATAGTALLAFLNDTFTGMVGNYQTTPGILSRWVTPPTAPPGTPATERNPPIITPISGIVIRDQRWDVQRRRSVPGI